MGYTFDGPNKRIILTTTDAVEVTDLFSRWKDWVLAGNSQFAPAFRSVAGDPIAPGQVIAPYIFLNTTDGWRIRPAEANHELRLSGNLYSEDPAITMFALTLGSFMVNVIIERSSAAIGVDLGGGGAPTTGQIASAVWSQLRTLPSAGSMGEALVELFLLMGLDPAKPLVTTASSRKVPADGSDINQVIAQFGNTMTVVRS